MLPKYTIELCVLKWVCFKLKKHVSLVRCCPHPKLVSPDHVFVELNTDEVTLIWPLLEGLFLNVIFSEDMIGYVREYK